MAQYTVVTLLDDIDGTEAEGTTRFSLNGRNYEIDLNAGHRQDLEDALAWCIKAAREVSGNGTTRGRKRVRSPRTGDIRAWAKGQGIALSDRGRIPVDVVAQYEAQNA